MALDDLLKIPQEIRVKVIKGSLKVIVLSLLKEKPRCGKNIIDIIAEEYGVQLLKIRVYPVLYALREEGYATIKLATNTVRKAKMYYLTPAGEELAEKEFEDFAKKVEAHSILYGSLRQKYSSQKD